MEAVQDEQKEHLERYIADINVKMQFENDDVKLTKDNIKPNKSLRTFYKNVSVVVL